MTRQKYAYLLWTALLALGLSGCGSDDSMVGGGGNGGGGSNNSTTEVAWSITDNCADGSGIELRFFDPMTGAVYPSATDSYLIPSDESRALKFRCEIGNTVCWGGDTSPPTGKVWGLGLDGMGNCVDCCETCSIGLSEADSLPCI